MGDSMFKTLCDDVAAMSLNASSLLTSNITSLNNSFDANTNLLIPNWTVPHVGVIGVSIKDLSSTAKLSLFTNGSASYLKDGNNLDINTVYNYDFYANKNDYINFQFNATTTVKFDLYFRRG